ncbi:hypothetical protein CBS101457_006862 [Exobasidium rhododendri]|nr:hypothetical protein CBS101457_006862 [Exobasidium rhododendri]
MATHDQAAQCSSSLLFTNAQPIKSISLANASHHRPQPLDLSVLSTYASTQLSLLPEDHCDSYDDYWDEDALAIDAIALPSYLRGHIINTDAGIKSGKGGEMADVSFQKRGGKGMSRHLFTASLSAAIAVSTAGVSLFANSLKAHDQDKYGVSRKAGLSDGTKKDKDKDKEKSKTEDDEEKSNTVKVKGGDGKDDDNSNNSKKKGHDARQEEGKEDDDDDKDSPDSPSFTNNITMINKSIYISTPETRINRSVTNNDARKYEVHKEESNDQVEGDEEEDLHKRAGIVAPPKAKGWKKYDHWAPLLEKIEDYGKVTAALGASAAAIVMAYASGRAHLAYKKKDEENEEEEEKAEKQEKDKWKGKGREKDDGKENDKHKRDLWESADDQEYALLPSILPTHLL